MTDTKSTYGESQKRYYAKIEQKLIRFNPEKLKDKERMAKLARLPKGEFSARVKKLIDSWSV